jgi:hypothetical protein
MTKTGLNYVGRKKRPFFYFVFEIVMIELL